MGFENFQNKTEKEVVKLTTEEVLKYLNMKTNDPELISWMKEKNIQFDQGMIDIEIDGKKTKMESNRDDFGTCSYYNENEIISSQ